MAIARKAVLAGIVTGIGFVGVAGPASAQTGGEGALPAFSREVSLASVPNSVNLAPFSNQVDAAAIRVTIEFSCCPWRVVVTLEPSAAGGGGGGGGTA